MRHYSNKIIDLSYIGNGFQNMLPSYKHSYLFIITNSNGTYRYECINVMARL